MRPYFRQGAPTDAAAAADTILVEDTVQTGAPVRLKRIIVDAIDPTAREVVTVDVRVNGVPYPPYTDLVAWRAEGAGPIPVDVLVSGGAHVAVVARNSGAGPVRMAAALEGMEEGR